MKPDAYARYYGNDFEAATKGWSRSVKWSYWSCLWYYRSHTHCTGLLDDDDFLRRLCECDTQDWLRTKGLIFDNERFFRLENGRWHQKRAKQDWLDDVDAYNQQLKRTEKARQANPDNRLGETRKAVTAPVTAPVTGQQPESEPEPYIATHISAPVEPHVGFPKTEAEARLACANIGCPEDFAAAQWNQAMGRGGRDHRGEIIRSWSHYLAGSWGFAKDRAEQTKLKTKTNHATNRPTAPDRNAGTYNNQPLSAAARAKVL